MQLDLTFKRQLTICKSVLATFLKSQLHYFESLQNVKQTMKEANKEANKEGRKSNMEGNKQ